MFKHVTIIALLVSSTYAVAAPRWYKPPQRVKKPLCEKILVANSIEEQVNEMAITVNRLLSQLKVELQKQDQPGYQYRFMASEAEIKQFAAQLAQMKETISQIRKTFTIPGAAAQVESGIMTLKLMMDEYIYPITIGLNLVAVPPTSTVARPRGFMKREVFGEGGPWAGMEDWPAAEVEAIFREKKPSASQAVPPRADVPPFLFLGDQNWPPNSNDRP